ncbi:MAG: sigma-70 family RNA polymerase sigma factor [Pirellulales bacterium]
MERTSQQKDTAELDERETQLVRSLKAGNPVAFEQLVREYSGRLLVVAIRFLGQEQDAQDAFLSAFKSIEKFEGNSKLSTWLHRIVVNASLMKLRTRKRKPLRPIEDILPQFSDSGGRTAPEPLWSVTYDTAVQDRETRDLVRQSISELPDSYRTVLLLRDIEQISTEETAQQMGISIGAVKTRLHSARQALKTLLDPYMQGEI